MNNNYNITIISILTYQTLIVSSTEPVTITLACGIQQTFQIPSSWALLNNNNYK